MDNQKKNEENNAKKPDKKRLIIIVAAVVVAVAIALTVIFVTQSQPGSDNKKSTADQASKSGESGDGVSKMPEDVTTTFSIDLGFIELKYPECWKEQVTIDGAESHKASDSFTVTFSKGDDKLFDLIFNGAEGDLIGTISGLDYGTTVSVKTYDGKSSKDEAFYAMQENLNVILNNLRKDYGISEGSSDTDSGETFEIETDVVTLYYPKKWESTAQIKKEGSTVHFMYKDKNVFDIVFGESKGAVLGTYDGTDVSVVEYEAKTDEALEMKEDINIILAHLREDPKFVEA